MAAAVPLTFTVAMAHQPGWRIFKMTSPGPAAVTSRRLVPTSGNFVVWVSASPFSFQFSVEGMNRLTYRQSVASWLPWK